MNPKKAKFGAEDAPYDDDDEAPDVKPKRVVVDRPDMIGAVPASMVYLLAGIALAVLVTKVIR